MDNKKKVVVLGIGNCGSQIAALAAKKYPEIFDSVYINSSDADLAMVTAEDAIKFKIGEKEHAEGSGKNRDKMKEYLESAIDGILNDEKFQDAIVDKKYCFIVASAAGGTGSGAAPIMMALLRQAFPDTNYILVSVLPQYGASLMEQGNTLEFLTELYEAVGNCTYMMYDNQNTAELPPTMALEVVNENVVEDLKVLSGVDNFPTPYESIDEADLESILTTPGRLLVVRLTKGLTEKVMEDANLDEMIKKTIKQSCHTETDRNKRVVRWGVITYFTDAVNRLYDGSLEGVREFIGTPVERFNHNAINTSHENANFLYLIASGLSPVNDRVTKVTERIDELKEALAGDESSKFILSGSSTYSDIMSRREQERHAGVADDLDIQGIFGKFKGKK